MNNGAFAGSSRGLDLGTSQSNPGYYLSSDYDIGMFYNGFVNCISPWTRPLGCYLGLVKSDPLNKVDIWIKSYAWHGTPLIQVSQTAGSWSRSLDKRDNLPLTGTVQLDMFQTTLPMIQKNKNNFNLDFYP